MPRNDQITRQWHLLRRLEGSTGLILHELVDAVPDDYPNDTNDGQIGPGWQEFT